MKKIIIALLFSQLMWAQQAYNTNDNVFNQSQNQNQDQGQTDADPGVGGGIGGEDPVPIDDYIPALAVIGLGMAVYFGRKKVVNAS